MLYKNQVTKMCKKTSATSWYSLEFSISDWSKPAVYQGLTYII